MYKVLVRLHLNDALKTDMVLHEHIISDFDAFIGYRNSLIGFMTDVSHASVMANLSNIRDDEDEPTDLIISESDDYIVFKMDYTFKSGKVWTFAFHLERVVPDYFQVTWQIRGIRKNLTGVY